jgi:hypothetical protein
MSIRSLQELVELMKVCRDLDTIQIEVKVIVHTHDLGQDSAQHMELQAECIASRLVQDLYNFAPDIHPTTRRWRLCI